MVNGKVTWKTEDKQTIFYCLFPLLRFPEFDCIKLKDMQQITDKKKYFPYSRITIAWNANTTGL